MVDEIITRQELIDAQKDAKTLEDVINGAANIQVLSRLGRTFWTLATLNSKINSVETAATQGLININNDVASVEAARVVAESQMNAKVASVEQIFDSKLSEWDDEAQTEINGWRSAISLITQEDGIPALAVSDASGKTQQEINDQLNARTYYIEDFGASKSATPAENSSAFLAALSNLKSGDSLLQTSDVLTIDRVRYDSTTDVFNVKFNLKFKFSKSSGVGACVRLSKFKESLINISIDGDNGPATLLRLDQCTGSVVPVETELKNAIAVESSADVVAGLFTSDSDEMSIVCTIKNIIATAGTTKVSRGVMISDTFITKNTSYIAPRVINIWKEYGGSTFGADGVYAEHSNADHAGGLRLQNGYYEDCAQRFFKITMPNPTITGNVGRTTKSQGMYSFVSSYKDQAGIIANNNFESVACAYGIELGVGTQEIKGVVAQNRLVTKTASASSYAMRVSGSMKNVQINLAETSGFSAILSHFGADSAIDQVIVLSGSEFDNLGGLNNGIVLRGDFKTANISDVSVKNSVTGRYFLSAPEISDGVLNINNIKHSYSYGTLGGMSSRANNLTDGSSTRFESTKMIMRRATIPASGTYRAGDIVEYTSPGSWVGAVYDGSQWRNYGLLYNFTTVTYDPPSIPADGDISTTVSLDGATVGSLVQAAFSVYNASIRIYAVVSSSNTVTVTFENTSSSAIDLGSGTLRVKLV